MCDACDSVGGDGGRVIEEMWDETCRVVDSVTRGSNAFFWVEEII